MNITLTSHFQSFIAEQLKGGRYQDASEVIRAALRAFEEAELKRSLADFAASFRKIDRHAPPGEPNSRDLAEISRIVKAQRTRRRQSRSAR